MRLAQIEGGIVVNVIEVDPGAIPDWAAGWPEAAEAGPGWTWDGTAFASPEVAPADAPTEADYTAAIDAHVEAVARSRRYNSAAHIASYATSTVAQWAAEAIAFVAWRDAVWLQAIGVQQAVLAGQMAAPSISETVASLPAPPWPVG